MNQDHSQDDILHKLAQLLHTQFDIDPARVVPSATLAQDLDLDSIDAVDLMVQLKPLVGKRLASDTFKSVRTVQDLVVALHVLMQPDGNP
jgi:acyl carrier protein